MRTYTNTLLFESALDSISPSNTLLYNVASRLLSPYVKVVEANCGTVLGGLVPLEENSVGEVELSNGLRLNSSRISTLSLTGASYVAIRSLPSCISKGGVCLACLSASRPRLSGVVVGNTTKISPELPVSIVKIKISAGTTTATLPYSTSEYDSVYIFNGSSLLATSEYSISGTTLTLTVAPGIDTFYMVRFIVISNVAYFYWLSNTYSGSLLGIKNLINLQLPVKPSIVRASINTTDIDVLATLLRNSEVKDEDFVSYIPNIKDSLEKAIFVITLNSIFLN